MSKYSKEKNEIIKTEVRLIERRKEIIKQGEENIQVALSRLNEDDLALSKKSQKIRKVYKILERVTAVISWPFAILIGIVAYKLGIMDWFHPFFSFLLIILAVVVSYIFFYFFIGQILFGELFVELKLKKIEKNPDIKAYNEACDQASRDKDQIDEQIKKLKEKYAEYEKWEKGEKVFNAIGKGISFLEEMGDSAYTPPKSDYSHSVNDGGYKTGLKLDERQGGYDAEHGWYDTYKDENGRSWGSTDGGKTFFKK